MGNNIHNNTYAGISVEDAVSNVTITENSIHQNARGGISIQSACELEITRNDIHDNVRGGIHTGTEVENGGGFSGDVGSAILAISQNEVHHNGGSGYGGGIDVRHASGTIENNLVYQNRRGGIRFFYGITDVMNNTVADNGRGGIIYDDLVGGVNDRPAGISLGGVNVQYNISAYNQSAGLRVCFSQFEMYESRDYNLLYSNNKAGETDCGLPDNPDFFCIQAQYGGCGAYRGASGIELYSTNDIIDDPLFTSDYRSPLVGLGIDW
jgi:parallel beta-helix repeat protein